MIIVDTHCHAATNWFEPIELILYQMNLNGVDKAVLIQNGGNYNNQYLLESVRRFPGRFAAVISVNPSQPDALATLERWVNEAKGDVAGLRLRPTDRSPGKDPLAIWRKAAELGLPVSCFVVNAEHTASPDFRNLVEALPNCTIVLEHLAGVYRRVSPESATPPYTAYRTALELASYPNTYIKFGGLGELCEQPAPLPPRLTFDKIPPLIEMAYETFGPRRMMWGSDFPPVASREGYRNALQGTMNHSAFRSQEDREYAFAKTALSIWKFPEG
ncbi:MAG: amidohydrolase family protein [Chloroflexota bacterium]